LRLLPCGGGGRDTRKGRDGPDAAGVVPSLPLRLMRLDQNTHALVLATAFLTSVSFAIFAMNLIALVLSHLLA
jgi:hypothetical protein